MYAVFFDTGKSKYRLPTNPEEIEVSSTQAINKFEVLKLGQIAVPTHMELKQYSFECEFPLQWYSYVETKKTKEDSAKNNSNEDPIFKSANFYIKLFSKWQENLIPVRFIAGRVIKNDNLHDDSINIKVLIEDLSIKERAGEEGDKYISFKLLEYRDFDRIKQDDNKTNPKNKGTYVVQSGDSLWAIAKKYYGNGSKYTKIYNANKDKIKNPSLIYPGQKLVIP
ncbi:LysM peptidoglycan-binding domain-containing protein [Anaerocolumna sp. AGMB13025]|uniref:LysM peptidoglycan-binding domain-containing protein n=1 Tax=Anaerocolumna sp. AGMB13025 TaxID=3039116 RepID=UPI002F416E4F